MSLTRKWLMTLATVAVVTGVTGVGTFSAFSSTTSNTGNSFSAGTVVLADNDANAAFYNVSGQKPGDTVTKCIKVTYTGSLAASVKLYTDSTIGSLGQYIDLTITPGSGAISGTDCANFTSDGSNLYAGTLAGFASTHPSYASGLSDNPGTTATSWATNDSVVYRFTLTLQDNNSAQGLTTGTHGFKWEARNQ